MSSRILEYNGDQWKATAEGLGVGAFSVTRWSMQFECVSNPEKGNYRGHIRETNPYNVSEEDLRRALKRAIKKG